MTSPITYNADGTCDWIAEEGDGYLVTGVDVYGKRFRVHCVSWAHARGYNLWRGTKWLVRGGKRFRIQRVYN